MINKNGIVVITLISAILFCCMPIVVSLSPLANLGPHANQFSSLGMWAAVACFFVLYAPPLIIYMLRVGAMRYVMAVLCGLGLLVNLASVGIIVIISVFNGIAVSGLQGVIGLYIAASIVNVIWFFVAFRVPSKIKNDPHHTVN